MSKFVAQMAALFLIVSTCAPLSAAQRSVTDVATQIRSTFDSRLAELQPETRYHYALRMYRITGDSSYIPPVAEMIPLIRKQLSDDLDSLGDSTYLMHRRELLMNDIGENNRKSRARSDLFRSRGSLIVDLAILSDCYRLADHAAPLSVNDSLIVRAKDYLKTVDFTRLVNDQRIVIDYSAQAANAIYYLHFLGIADLRADYLELFRRTFPDLADNHLSDLEFGDKIYGLTHLIIASSRYYQQTVDSAEFAWILKYFDSRKKRILNETKPDIVTEVGICFLLAGDSANPLVDACRHRVARAFSSADRLIPSAAGSSDIETGEHRNVLVFILLAWPNKLHSGPTW